MKNHKPCNSRHGPSEGNHLWVDGLLCAYEYIPAPKKCIKLAAGKPEQKNGLFDGSRDSETTLKCPKQASERLQETGKAGAVGDDTVGFHPSFEAEEMDVKPSNIEPKTGPNSVASPKVQGSHWIPIGWMRLEELVQSVQIDAQWEPSESPSLSDEYDVCVADLAAPYWERKAGATWWCNLLAGHPHVESWLANSQKWLHPAVSKALKDESKLISERMKYLYYEVPTRVAGGLLFELLGQSVGDAHHDEADVPIVLRSWQAQNFLVTSLHVKETVNNLNVLGIVEVQDLIGAGGAEVPKSVSEVIAQLANRLARWDDRLFRKNIFGAADEVELTFVNRKENEDLDLLNVIMDREIRRLSTQAIRVKWSLHAREEIMFELAQHLKGATTQDTLATVRSATRDMLAEQEAVRDRIFTVQDAMHNALRSVLQDKSVRITHYLTVFGGCGLVLSIITGLFGINVDGIPGSSDAPLTFLIFSICVFGLGAILVVVGFLFFGLKRPISESQLAARKQELQQLVESFQQAAESHANVRSAGPLFAPADEQSRKAGFGNDGYVLIM